MKMEVIGSKHGQLTILADAYIKMPNYIRFVECLCSCGNIVVRRLGDIRHGKQNSCGCLVGKSAHERFFLHGKKNSKEYNSWRAMLRRCDQKSGIGYHNYGGRGIMVCKRWKDAFTNFLEDMGEMPTPKHTIDRINVNGHYRPSNCRWATRKERALNTRKHLK